MEWGARGAKGGVSKVSDCQHRVLPMCPFVNHIGSTNRHSSHQSTFCLAWVRTPLLPHRVQKRWLMVVKAIPSLNRFAGIYKVRMRIRQVLNVRLPLPIPLSSIKSGYPWWAIYKVGLGFRKFMPCSSLSGPEAAVHWRRHSPFRYGFNRGLVWIRIFVSRLLLPAAKHTHGQRV